MTQAEERAAYDYIVVGSGAGGGPLAARLAQRGSDVLVLEAGSDAYPEYAQVPLLHPQSTEDPQISWEFMVRHYASDAQAKKDPKADTNFDVFYPRAAALGGCTVHNAMITICGGNDEWNRIAQLTGDDSWTGERMRMYFERLERCTYLEQPKPGEANPGRHGFDGWLTTTLPDFSLVAGDPQLRKIILAMFHALAREQMEDPKRIVRDLLAGRIKEHLDPNDWRRLKHGADGLVLLPLATREGQRNGPRDFLLEVQRECKEGRCAGQITITSNALVTKVIFDEAEPSRVVGVEVRLGEHLYRADPNFSAHAPYPTVQFRCTREVILCGGAFNTPQLLMLSGIGPEERLSQLGLPCISDLAGVGQNLQDRYEVAVVHRMRDDFDLLKNVTLDVENPDPELRQWLDKKSGIYTTSGAVLGVFLRSNPELSQPDLFVFALPGNFRGYEKGYSRKILTQKNVLTWAILKASTKNRGGTVTLRTADPSDVPDIDFHYFEEGGDRDLAALVAAVKCVEKIERYHEYPFTQRLDPPPDAGDDEALKDWIRARAWGHHACGTCRVGRSDDPLAVVDSRFRVRGVRGLRVVDASIFPEIPGFFIVTNTYMISEKAADAITEDWDDPMPPDFASGAKESQDVRERYWQRFIQAYPKKLREKEAELIKARRSAADCPTPAPSASTGTAPNDPSRNGCVGFAISGGGIRSATFHLGLLQVLARTRLLPQIDIFSTVSGGGYIGAFVGRLFTRAVPKAQNVPEGVCQRIEDSRSEEVEWLRRSANYIAPNHQDDVPTTSGVFLRSFLTIHFILLLTLFTVLGLLNLLTEITKSAAGRITKDYFSFGPPVYQHLAALFQHKFHKLVPDYDTLSPIFWVTEFIFWTMVLGTMIAFWLASQTRRERFDRTALQLALWAMIVFVFLMLRPVRNFVPELIWVLFALFSAFIWVEVIWQRVRAEQGSPTVATDPVASQAARNLSSRALGATLVVFGGFFALALVDTFGRLFWYFSRGKPWPTFLSLGGISMAILPILRMLAKLLTGPVSVDGWVAFLLTSFRKNLLPTFTVLLLAVAPLSLIAFLVQVVYDGGHNVLLGAIATAVAIVACVVLRFAHQLVNHSSLYGTYAARLGRAFLGASNPTRRDYDGTNRVTDVIRGDDETWYDYKPHVYGGPYHLVNIAINQTYNVDAREEIRDRKSENMVVSPLGVSVGVEHHALWETRQNGETFLQPICSLCPGPHPFRTTDDVKPPERLNLAGWVAVSGAAISPGAGRSTGLNHSLVFTLANLRTGYWWDSGAKRAQRLGLPPVGKLRRWLFAVPAFFSTQTSLLNEAMGNFGGPWFRTWYLSDGGFFEVTGAYELIRRRVRYIILGDSGEDPLGRFDDLSNLILKARIDFDAKIRFLEAEELEKHPRVAPFLANLERKDPAQHASILRALGGLADLRPDANGFTRKHAALGFVYYDDCDKPGSVILYLKATRSGDEDVDLLRYAAANPAFPNESTGNQFFDEPQWESYRRLGEHIGTLLFQNRNSLWWRDLLP